MRGWRKTHCKYGHERTAENVQGGSGCITCHAIQHAPTPIDSKPLRPSVWRVRQNQVAWLERSWDGSEVDGY